MVGKLSCLPADTQVAMQHLACLGHGAGHALLAMVYGDFEGGVSAGAKIPQ